MCASSLIETPKDTPDAMVEFREGVEFLKNEYPEKALAKLKAAFEKDRKNPYFISFLGLAIGRSEQNWDRASELCETAVRLKRKEIQFHLNLVEVYAKRLFGNDSRLRRIRSKLEKRRAPVLSFLERNNFLNRELGKLRHRIFQKRNK
jgi:predicted O-linked N-acetylglucosamine transferase (SPINDLY family)